MTENLVQPAHSSSVDEPFDYAHAYNNKTNNCQCRDQMVTQVKTQSITIGNVQLSNVNQRISIVTRQALRVNNVVELPTFFLKC